MGGKPPENDEGISPSGNYREIKGPTQFYENCESKVKVRATPMGQTFSSNHRSLRQDEALAWTYACRLSIGCSPFIWRPNFKAQCFRSVLRHAWKAWCDVRRWACFCRPVCSLLVTRTALLRLNVSRVCVVDIMLARTFVQRNFCSHFCDHLMPTFLRPLRL